MACLDENQAADYVHRALAPAAVSQVEAHLAECSDCRRVTAELARLSISGTSDTQTALPPSLELPPGTALGRYQIQDCVGRGGMGVVYRAFDPKLRRSVAVKIWRIADRGAGTEAAREALLREARALAKVSHPNVVAVHDVGSFDNDVFIAMELVDGPSLREWLQAHTRSESDIVGVLRQAGRGLQAAHDAGIVHRDFKPDNIKVGRDGRVRVLDFGLAVDERSEDGEVAGTPAYMAPEQLAGQSTDAQADVFAFAVTLHEALTGKRPKERLDPQIPSWLAPLLEKALAPERSLRLSSVSSLLEGVERHYRARSRRRHGAVAFSCAAVAAAATFLLVQASASHPCEGAERELVELWNAETRTQLERAFVAASPSFGKDAFLAVAEELDAFTASWAIAFRESCEATHVLGEQSAQRLDTQMHCLQRRQLEFAAIVRELHAVDGDLVVRAPRNLYRLPRPSACRNLDAHDAERPETPDEQRQLQRLETLVADIEALRWAGRNEDAAAKLEELTDGAAELGWEPLKLEATFYRGYLAADLGDAKKAESALSEALYLAIAARDNVIAARAATTLISVVGYDQGRFEDAEAWIRHARAALRALGDPADRMAEFENNVGAIRERQSRLDDAERHYRLAGEAWTEVHGDDSAVHGIVFNNLGMVEYQRGKPGEALKHFVAAHDIFRDHFGPRHPYLVSTSMNIGAILADRGETAKAKEYHQESLAIAKESLGESKPLTLKAMANLAIVADMEGDRDAARAQFEAVLALQKKVHGESHADVARTLQSLGLVEEAAGRNGEALSRYQAALAMREELEGASSYDATYTRLLLANLLRRLGHAKDARAAARTAVAAARKLFGEKHHEVARALTQQGLAEVALGSVRLAKNRFQQAERIWETANGGRPISRVETAFGLAQVLWAEGHKTQALTKARDARAALQGESTLAADIDTWLETVSKKK